MTRFQQHIHCPQCQREVEGERHVRGSSQTWVWRCECGWARVVADSGVLDRRAFQRELERRRARRGSGVIPSVSEVAGEEEPDEDAVEES